jgi:tetratricopeptide (TPR) repeat protein
MPVLRLAALLLALAGPALADVTSEAREHFKKGQTHYALGEFDDAAKEFREAYRLRQEPAILFNIGQAYRQMQQYQQAYFHYRQYLAQKPDAPNRPEVDALVEQMRRKADLEEEQRSRIARDPSLARNPEDVLPSTAKAPAAATGAANLPQARTRPLRIAGYAALGAGAAAEGLALLWHGAAASAADEFNRKYAAQTLTAADARLKSDAESKGRLATAALIGGAVLLAAGAALSFAF